MIETPLRVGAHQRGAAHARSNVRRSDSSSPPLWEWAQAFPAVKHSALSEIRF